MIINELFNKVADWDYEDVQMEYGEAVTAAFIIQDKDGVEQKYEVQFEEMADEDDLTNMDTPFLPNTGGVWELNFVSSVVGGRFNIKTNKITGSGNELLVFATVLDIINKATGDHNINNITFGASDREPSRVKLYHRLMKRLSNSWDIIPPAKVQAEYKHLSELNYQTWIMIKKGN